MTSPATSLAATFAAAHRQRRELDAGTLPVPATMAEALAVQVDYANDLGATAGGWKVGVTPDGDVVGAPIFADLFLPDDCRLPLGPRGSTGIEVEIALRLKQDLPARPQGYSRDDVLDATAEVLVGIELIESRIAAFQAAPFKLFVADLMANRGYVPGAGIADFRALPLDRLRCTLSIAGKRVHDAVGGHANGDPLVPAVAFASRPTAYLGGFRKGQIITLGSMCGMIPATEPGPVEARIEGIGRVGLTLG